MNNFSGRVYLNNLSSQNTNQNIKQITNQPIKDNYEDEHEDEEEITPQYIIKNKPKPSIVRDFFKYNLESIIDEDEKDFIDSGATKK